MNSPPEPGSPSLSTPSSSSPPPDEFFPQETARTTDLLNMVASGYDRQQRCRFSQERNRRPVP
ncbi:hypothetical protein CPB85DRAFT_1431256 [Mucidula mucida]|nr:hypothetical protein CPB85DRAFT_1431256 [Mucidula mucida]